MTEHMMAKEIAENEEDYEKKLSLIRDKKNRDQFISWIKIAVNSNQNFFLVFYSSIDGFTFAGFLSSWERTAEDIKRRINRTDLENDPPDYFFVTVVMIETEKEIIKNSAPVLFKEIWPKG